MLVLGNEKDVKVSILDGLGVLGWAKAKVVFVPCNKAGKVIVSVSTKGLNDVLASFELSGKIKVQKVSGTIKGLGVS